MKKIKKIANNNIRNNFVSKFDDSKGDDFIYNKDKMTKSYLSHLTNYKNQNQDYGTKKKSKQGAQKKNLADYQILCDKL